MIQQNPKYRTAPSPKPRREHSRDILPMRTVHIDAKKAVHDYESWSRYIDRVNARWCREKSDADENHSAHVAAWIYKSMVPHIYVLIEEAKAKLIVLGLA